MKLGRQRFAELFALGLTYDQMSLILGVTKRALYKWRVELKKPRRKTGPRRLE
jgi:hypothetical protein